MPGNALRVLYNARAVPERPAGAGVYTTELGRALAAREDVELLVASPRDLGFGTRVGAASSRREQLGLELSGREPGLAELPDVYHGPHMFTPRTDVPTVATIHDLTFLRLPRRYDFLHRRYYRFLAGTAQRADRVIVPSKAVASDVVKYLGYDAARIRVIAEAPRAGLVSASYEHVRAWHGRTGLEGPFLLCLGSAEPGKRAVDAIRAMPKVLERCPGTFLVIAGNPGRLSEPLKREAARLGVAESVRFLGYVSDEDLVAMLTVATALVFPSLYEGFGLPPLEAMACGTPVIATDAPAMREVLAGAATFVPVRDPESIAAEAVRFLADATYRAERGAAGLEFVSRFSWAKAAAETLAVYREVAS